MHHFPDCLSCWNKWKPWVTIIAKFWKRFEWCINETNVVTGIENTSSKEMQKIFKRVSLLFTTTKNSKPMCTFYFSLWNLTRDKTSNSPYGGSDGIQPVHYQVKWPRKVVKWLSNFRRYKTQMYNSKTTKIANSSPGEFLLLITRQKSPNVSLLQSQYFIFLANRFKVRTTNAKKILP